MRRRLFNAAAAVSLLLCVALVALWVWSHQSLLSGAYCAGVDLYAADFARGSVQLRRNADQPWRQMTPPRPQPPRWKGSCGILMEYHDFLKDHPNRNADLDWHSAGVRLVIFRASSLGKGTWVTHWLIIPLWMLALATALPPALWVRSALSSHRRSRAGLCPSCGYDLRATPERCPECGHVPKVMASGIDAALREG